MPDPISWSFAAPYLIGAVVAGYLLGSIPFGLLLTRLFGLGDIRKIGSGNIGATNVLRTGHKGVALATLILDGAKGAIALLIAYWLYGTDMGVAAGLGALLGHMFPVWLLFRGGKGVATALGLLLAAAWPVGLMACLTWLVVAFVFRYSSLAALASIALSPLYAKALAHIVPVGTDLGEPIPYHQLAELALAVAVLVWIRHHSNIKRLASRTEPKIGAKKKAADANDG